MVTPRTGRPRGRPPKPKEPEPNRRRGRPEKRLASDPDRYLLAAIQAHIEIGVPATRVTEIFAGLRFGHPFQTDENLEAMDKGEKFLIFMHKLKGGNVGETASYRDRNAFRPPADNLRRKLSYIRTRPMGDPDRRWLTLMTRAWLPCLRGESDGTFGACLSASLAGEIGYFYVSMLPVMIERSRQRITGAPRAEIDVPEFRRLLFPTI
jgi:hypothetical protein